MKYRVHEKNTGETMIHLKGCEKRCNGKGCNEEGIKCLGKRVPHPRVLRHPRPYIEGDFMDLDSVWSEARGIGKKTGKDYHPKGCHHCMTGYYFCVRGEGYTPRVLIHVCKLGRVCNDCNYGEGQTITDAPSTEWYGPYQNIDSPRQRAESLGHDVGYCQHCRPKPNSLRNLIIPVMDFTF